MSYSTKGEADHSETERYNRLSFAVRDPRGRIVTGDEAIVSEAFLTQEVSFSIGNRSDRSDPSTQADRSKILTHP